MATLAASVPVTSARRVEPRRRELEAVSVGDGCVRRHAADHGPERNAVAEVLRHLQLRESQRKIQLTDLGGGGGVTY
jgi:hypothetical protein